MCSAHKISICEVCYENRTLFLFEHTLFRSKNELTNHTKMEHTMCMFCRIPVFDPALLYVHMRDCHRSCPHCPRRFEFRYYKDESMLRQHVEYAHFLCKQCNSLQASFATHGLYSDHMLSQHGVVVRNKYDLGSFLSSSTRDATQYIDLQDVGETRVALGTSPSLLKSFIFIHHS